MPLVRLPLRLVVTVRVPLGRARGTTAREPARDTHMHHVANISASVQIADANTVLTAGVPFIGNGVLRAADLRAS